MKILLIHYRFSIIGGPERYLFNIKQVFEEKDHTVIPFSIAYDDNQTSDYDNYFPIPKSKEFHLHKVNLMLKEKILLARNFIFNKNVFNNLSLLIKETQPDIAYILKYDGKLTYAVQKACVENNIPMVLRISDFTQFCAVGTFLRNGEICENCYSKPFSVVKEKCVHNSLSKSFLSYISKRIEINSGYLQKTKVIICPSNFTSTYFKNSTIFRNSDIKILPTFYNFPSNIVELKDSLINLRIQKRIISYIGRISNDKGILCLVKAMEILQKNKINCTLKLVGFNDDEYSFQIKKYIKTNKINNIICVEFCNKQKMDIIIDDSLTSIVPSIWYDNMPNSLIESQSKGVPVIATKLGSLKELITDGKNGLLFKRNDTQDLAEKILALLKMDYNQYVEVSRNSLEWALDYCSKDKHYDELIQCFSKIVKNSM